MKFWEMVHLPHMSVIRHVKCHMSHVIFTNSAPPGWVGHIVTMSVGLSVFVSGSDQPLDFWRCCLIKTFSPSHRVAMSVAVCVCAIGCSFFLVLSLALRSHDQIQASHWLTPQNSFKDFGGYLLHRFWKKIVSKILEEMYLRKFGGTLLLRFWRKFVSKILE